MVSTLFDEMLNCFYLFLSLTDLKTRESLVLVFVIIFDSGYHIWIGTYLRQHNNTKIMNHMIR